MLTSSQILASKPVVALVGPTAIGKTRLAIEVAKVMGTEILTADSRQVYRGMDIGTDKPTMAERQGVSHRLIDLVDPDQPFNVGDYRRHAVKEIDRLHREGRIPLVAGGTGLYIRAILRGLWEGPPADWNLRQQLDRQAEENGPEYLYQELVRVDPVRALHLHPHDHVKIQRALEVYSILGTPLSEAHRQHRFQDTPYKSWIIGFTMERENLYRRIEERVELELAKGLVHETKQLMEQGYHRELGSMKSLGYRQIAGFVAGEYDYQEAVRRLKRDTRHFAKRQLTWFRKEPGIHWIQLEERDSLSQVAQHVSNLIQQLVSTMEDGDDGEPLHAHHLSSQTSVLHS
jgi:tRNA dimethylallyltransferase